MNDLPADVYYHVASYLSTQDAFVLSQVNQRWYQELQQCGWLWRTLRVDSDAHLHWSTAHKYGTRLKRKRNIVYMDALLRTKGGFLHKLVLGSLTAPLDMVFDSSCLLQIAAACPQLKSLKLCLVKVNLTHRAIRVLTHMCPQLRRLTLPVSTFFAPGQQEVDDNLLTTVRLFGDLKLAQSPQLTCFPRITTLKLTEVHNCISLSVMLCCPLLQHLAITDCTSTGDMHPFHMDPTLAHLQDFAANLKTLALIRCSTVICVAHVLDTLLQGHWPSLERLSLDNGTLAELTGNYTWFIGLSCASCEETPVYKDDIFHFLRCTRCSRCRRYMKNLQTVHYH